MEKPFTYSVHMYFMYIRILYLYILFLRTVFCSCSLFLHILCFVYIFLHIFTYFCLHICMFMFTYSRPKFTFVYTIFMFNADQASMAMIYCAKTRSAELN